MHARRDKRKEQTERRKEKRVFEDERENPCGAPLTKCNGRNISETDSISSAPGLIYASGPACFRRAGYARTNTCAGPVVALPAFCFAHARVNERGGMVGTSRGHKEWECQCRAFSRYRWDSAEAPGARDPRKVRPCGSVAPIIRAGNPFESTCFVN